MKLHTLVPRLRLAVALLGMTLPMVLTSCGGAIGSGGTGAAPPAVSGGTVTGFGSVVIDGLAIDDRWLATVAENEPSANAPAETRMGHRVELEVDSADRPTVLRVEATVVGSVASLDTTGSTAQGFSILGQAVTVNSDPAMGPVTQFGGGYAGAPDVRPGDWAEVHGVSRSVAGGSVIQATRIDKRATAPAYLRVSGIVSELGNGGSGRFTLGSLVVDSAAATLMPSGATLSSGSAVIVFALPADLAAPIGGPAVIRASAVRVKSFRGSGAETYASGFVTLLDAANAQFSLNGQTVKYISADVEPVGTTLTNGQYVQARGTVNADGHLIATRVTRRDGRSLPEAELKGSIVNFNDSSKTFLIRGVLVSLTSTTKLEDCPIGGLRDGLFVEMEGSLVPTGVTARKVECKDEPTGAVIEREGVAGTVDLISSSFTLTAAGKAPVKVWWTGVTYFRSVTPLTLSGKKVEVEGTLVNGDIVASKIKLED